MILVLKSSESLEALLEPEVDLWVRCLNDAMQGLGTDENSLSLTRGSARMHSVFSSDFASSLPDFASRAVCAG